MDFFWMIIINLILFLILLYAMKEIVTQALSEFKAEIIEEFRLKELMNRPSVGSTSDEIGIGNSTEKDGQAVLNSTDIELKKEPS